MRFQAMIATTNRDSQGEKLSTEALQQLAETAVGKHLSWEFKHDFRGVVDKTFVSDGCLIVEGELELYAVPGFFRSGDGKELTMFSVGLTDKPADSHLTPIQWIIKKQDHV